MAKTKTYKVGRSAITGQFITVAEALRKPKTTMVVRMKRNK